MWLILQITTEQTAVFIKKSKMDFAHHSVICSQASQAPVCAQQGAATQVVLPGREVGGVKHVAWSSSSNGSVLLLHYSLHYFKLTRCREMGEKWPLTCFVDACLMNDSVVKTSTLCFTFKCITVATLTPPVHTYSIISILQSFLLKTGEAVFPDLVPVIVVWTCKNWDVWKQWRSNMHSLPDWFSSVTTWQAGAKAKCCKHISCSLYFLQPAPEKRICFLFTPARPVNHHVICIFMGLNEVAFVFFRIKVN